MWMRQAAKPSRPSAWFICVALCKWDLSLSAEMCTLSLCMRTILKLMFSLILHGDHIYIAMQVFKFENNSSRKINYIIIIMKSVFEQNTGQRLSQFFPTHLYYFHCFLFQATPPSNISSLHPVFCRSCLFIYHYNIIFVILVINILSVWPMIYSPQVKFSFSKISSC